MKVIISLLCCFLITKIVFGEIESDYYWRDYTGVIPKDAIPGGLDINGKTTYIAQMYVANNGILPTRIYEGRREVTSSRDGIHTSELFVKILCGHNVDNFIWIPVTAANLHTQTINKHLVSGGTENGRTVNIGRVQYQGELIVGKSCSYNVGDALLFFPYNNQEIKAGSYEVLAYEKKNSTNNYVNYRSDTSTK